MTTPKPETYAASVVRVLREHFPDLADPATAEVVADLIERQVRDPKSSFEVIVDDPISAKWRLKGDVDNLRRVHLAIHRLHPREADAELKSTLNDALRALET
jgi:hypothetical protein